MKHYHNFELSRRTMEKGNRLQDIENIIKGSKFYICTTRPEKDSIEIIDYYIEHDWRYWAVDYNIVYKLTKYFKKNRMNYSTIELENDSKLVKKEVIENMSDRIAYKNINYGVNVDGIKKTIANCLEKHINRIVYEFSTREIRKFSKDNFFKILLEKKIINLKEFFIYNI